MSSLKTLLGAAGVLGLYTLSMPGMAQEAPAEPPKSEFQKAIDATKPIFQARLRYETVEQDNALSDADALTYRFRAGLQTGEAFGTSFLVEFDHVEDIVDDFNSTINGKGTFSVVPDPNVTELNRLQLVNKSLPDTTITLGRQRIILDDARFVGNVGWRQNEQTFDGLRVQNKSIGDLSVDVSYINRINRIFGDDSPIGVWEGDTILLNASHPTPIGKLTGFGYFIDVEEAGGNPSSQTLGVRLSGKQQFGDGKLTYALSAAQQEDYGESTLDYDADYYLIDAGYGINGFTVGAGYEVLGDDFRTPLATLHKFQGWSDVLLGSFAGVGGLGQTVQGVEDLYFKAGYAPGDLSLFKGTKFTAFYRDLSAESGGLDYGDEINFVANAKIGNVKALLKFANYNADEFAVDTQKIWIQFDYAF